MRRGLFHREPEHTASLQSVSRSDRGCWRRSRSRCPCWTGRRSCRRRCDRWLGCRIVPAFAACHCQRNGDERNEKTGQSQPVVRIQGREIQVRSTMAAISFTLKLTFNSSHRDLISRTVTHSYDQTAGVSGVPQPAESVLFEPGHSVSQSFCEGRLRLPAKIILH